MINIKLNEKQSKALISALTELHNSGDWAEHYSEEEVDEMFNVSKVIIDTIKVQNRISNQTKNK